VSENACFHVPELARTRAQMLDYFEAQKNLLDTDHLVFRFEHEMKMSTGDANLLKQLCLVSGFPYASSAAQHKLGGTLARYLVNKDPRIIKHYPEVSLCPDNPSSWSDAGFVYRQYRREGLRVLWALGIDCVVA
jgi:hypothetical protein